MELREGRMREDRTQGVRNPGKMEPRKQQPGKVGTMRTELQESSVGLGMGWVVYDYTEARLLRTTKFIRRVTTLDRNREVTAGWAL